MKPFLICTTTFERTIPVFDCTKLDAEQSAFVNGLCATQESKRPPKGKIPNNLAAVLYRSSDDFLGIVMAIEDPMLAQLEIEALWIDLGYTIQV